MTFASRMPNPVVTLDGAALDRLMPMHLRLDAQGAIRSVGPTLAKLLPASGVTGQLVGRVFALRRPVSVTNIAELRARIGSRLHLALKNDPALVLRGLALPSGDGGLLVNLSFGIWVHEAVRRYGLTVADFAATDLTVEMLYLVEAKSAVTEELRKLNLRLHGAKVAAEEQALTDTLTGLRNRRALDGRLADLVAQGQPFGLMHLDLDYFKQVNDSLGHAAGDHVLREVASVLVEETRANDLVARVGGDEFVLVFPGLADEVRVTQIARRIIDRLTEPMVFDGQSCRISASIGMTLSAYYDQTDSAQMHADADEALYTSKREGRGRATMHRPAANAGPE
jgi:diguanylate cyclase (GGDEF)-like protein